MIIKTCQRWVLSRGGPWVKLRFENLDSCILYFMSESFNILITSSFILFSLVLISFGAKHFTTCERKAEADNPVDTYSVLLTFLHTLFLIIRALGR